MFNDSVAHTKASLYDIFYASKARQTYTYLGVSLILVIVFLAFALVPTITTIGTVQEKIAAYDTLNTALKAKLETAKKLDAQMNTTSTDSPNGLKDEIGFMNKVFMTNYDLKPVYTNIYKRSKDNNSTINSITPKFPTVDSGGKQVDTFVVPASSQGYELILAMSSTTIENAVNFVKSLESYSENPLICRVKGFSITDIDASFKISPGNNSQAAGAKGITYTVDLIVYIDETRANP